MSAGGSRAVSAAVAASIGLLATTALAQRASRTPPPPPPPEPPREPVPPPPPRTYLAFAIGTGGGVIGGKTEGLEADVATGPQWAPLHLRADLAAFRRPGFALGVSGRLGFPIGSEIDSPAAKAVMFRAYWMCPIGLRYIASVGAGYLRYRVGVDGTTVDTMAAGPILAGFGTGWAFPISRSWRLVVDVHAMAAIRTSEKYGGVPNQHALHFDLDVGFQLLR
jgi:hypothetical protein